MYYSRCTHTRSRNKRTNRPDQEPLAELTARYRALAEISFVACGSVVSATTTLLLEGLSLPGRSGRSSRSALAVGPLRRRRDQDPPPERGRGRRYGEWIANRRRAEAILAELEVLSAQAAELVLAGATAEAPGEPGRRAKPG
ncbi:MAG: hypothetical protein ABIZ34_03780 [Candidatus Limnocylindrales bacterium]